MSCKWILFPILLIMIATAGLVVRYVYIDELHSPLDPAGEPRQFSVVPGWTFDRTCLELNRQGFIRDARFLQLYARLHPDRIEIKAGEYLLAASMTPLDIVEKLVEGRVITYSVTFPEGLTIREMAEIWDVSGFGTAQNFMSAATSYRDPTMPFPVTGWEGYLFPDTYLFTRDFDEHRLIEKMIGQLKAVLRDEWLAAARENSLGLHQVVTLASLIEKETRVPLERVRISSVFHNRLKKGMLLQCDPTVIYALGEQYTGKLLRKHLAIDHPHNTYVYPGLPPGPIGAPGKASLEAACFPADETNLYFVADATEGHVFSKTLAEHNQAVQRYRNWLRTQEQ